MSGVALLLGLPNEPPMVAVRRALERIGTPAIMLDQRDLVSGRAVFCGGLVDDGDGAVPLEAVSGAYTRLTTWSVLPGVTTSATGMHHACVAQAELESWLESSESCIVNRMSGNDSNNSKPYQAMIARDYFHVPATLVTNRPEAALDFVAQYGRVIYKSISGERSIVTEFTAADVPRLGLLTHAPVQFQEFVAGIDVRVHVVGDAVFPTSVESNAVDYRYDESGRTTMQACEISDEVAEACIKLTARLGLVLAGIDLRYADDGRVVCFEANPSPAFSVYEDETGQLISEAIARRLAGA